MKSEHWVVVLTILVGLAVWLVDAAIGLLFFPERSFLGLLIVDIPAYSLYVRLVVLAACLLFGLVTSGVVARQRKANEEMHRSAAHAKELAISNARLFEAAQQELAERKRVEGSLRRAEREKAIILDSMAEQVTYQDTDLRVLWANQTASAAVDKPPERLLGRHCYEIRYQRSAPCPHCPVVKALAAGQYQQGETTSPDGRVWFIRGHPILNEHGDVTSVVEVMLDITERRHAEAALERRTAQLEALHQVGLELSAESDLSSLLRSIVSRAIQLLGGTSGGLYLYRPERELLELVVAVGPGLAPVGSTLCYGDGLAGRVWATGEPLIVNDYSSWEGRAAVYAEYSWTAVVGVPARWGEKFLGVLDVLADAPHTFSASDVVLLQRFIPLAAVALENARLLEAERQQNAELEELRQASLQLTSSLRLPPVLEAILAHTLKLISADDAHIFLYDGEVLTFGAALSVGGHQREAPTEPRPQGLTYTVARSGEHIVIPNGNEHPLFQDRPWAGAIVGMPLAIGRQVVGVMNVVFGKPHPFSEDELRVLGLLADQAAVAIQNARLYGDLQEQMEKLKEAQAQVVQSARLAAVGELAAGVAHELNNPLTSVLGFSELLLEEMPANAPYRRDLGRISAEARRAREIIRSLLDFARQGQLQRVRTDINDILRQTLSLIGTHLEKSGVAVEEAYASDFGFILVDEEQLRQVFLNLINNAVQAMPEGGTLSIRTARERAGVTIAFSDSGKGMPPEVQEHLFEPFFTTRADGTGLGLAVSLGIIREHGGHIDVESEIGRGSTFTVWLPAAAMEVKNARGADPGGGR